MEQYYAGVVHFFGGCTGLFHCTPTPTPNKERHPITSILLTNKGDIVYSYGKHRDKEE